MSESDLTTLLVFVAGFWLVLAVIAFAWLSSED